MYNTLPLHITSHYGHHILYCIIPHRAKRHLWHYSKPHHILRHTIPHHLAHFMPHQHLSRHIPLQYHISNRTIGHIMHHTTDISHCTPFHFTLLTYHITPQFQIHHILATSFMRRTTNMTTSRPTFCTTIAPHFTCSPPCIIPPHLTVITHNSASDYHVSRNTPHHRSGHHYFLHPTTYHISHNTTSTTRYGAVSAHTLPHSTSHNVTFHIPCHSTRTNPHYTTTIHNPILV